MLIPAGAIISLCLSFGIDFNGRFISSRLKAVADGYNSTDENAIKYSQHKGLFLRFANFPDPIAFYSINSYFRSVFAIYPQRVLVADPSVPLFKWQDVRDHTFEPDDQWLNGHGIRAVVTYSYNPDGTISNSVRFAVANPMEGR